MFQRKYQISLKICLENSVNKLKKSLNLKSRTQQVGYEILLVIISFINHIYILGELWNLGGVNISYEVIVKYKGDILKLENELGVSVEIMSPAYAVIVSTNKESIEQLKNYTEIEEIEEPFTLEAQDVTSSYYSRTKEIKNTTNLTGKGTIIGIIDSGIDYTLPVFKHKDGKTKILYYWDQSIDGKFSKGFGEGSIYDSNEINKAIDGRKNIPISPTSNHGTFITSICSSIAEEADIIFVRVGKMQTDVFSKSTDFMRGIKFILDKSLELKMPVVINISYSINEESQKADSLFERYLDDMCLYCKNNIVIAARPNRELAITNPGTAKRVITVGSFNSAKKTADLFLGEGDSDKCIIYKPDLLAPGEGIESLLLGGIKYLLDGNGVAASYITGVCSLLMHWGIVKGNDPYLYSQKLKSFLATNCKVDSEIEFKNNLFGYEEFEDKQNFCYRNTQEKILKKTMNSRKIRYGFDNSILIFHNKEFKNDLKNIPEAEKVFIRISESLGILPLDDIPEEEIYRFLNLNSLEKIETYVRMSLLGYITEGTLNGVSPTEDIGIDFLKDNQNLSVTGKGVLISIADTGINYLHPDFIYPDGTSKIAYLWDQTKEGNPPEGFYVGTEYTREEINSAIKNKDDTLSKDEEGHGTMLSGIAAGLGNVNPQYVGVAKDAELVVIKLAKLDGYYNNAMLQASIQYSISKAIEMNRPLVSNISLGSNTFQGDIRLGNYGSSYFIRGFGMVAAAGNEGNTETHTSGRIELSGLSKEVKLELSEDEEFVGIEIFISRPDKVNVLVISPTGEETKDVQVSNIGSTYGLFNIENTEYYIFYNYPTTYSGQQAISIKLKNVKKGIWIIKLTGVYITSGEYNVYLQNRVFLKPGTKLVDASPLSTINYPAQQDGLITVGAYDSNNDSLWVSSSRGPNIYGMLKPDIVAPGVNIIGPYSNDKYAMVTGTSASAAIVSAVLALYYQYTLIDMYYPHQAFSQNVRTFLQAGAKRLSEIDYPNTSFGYGILDVIGLFNQFR